MLHKRNEIHAKTAKLLKRCDPKTLGGKGCG